ncbi:MAG: valine--tRNA ligase [Candidatus Omnitrophica bacterium]|nr:valine--tRNA ligase [Candidatus Omnitrophota bacterium]
MDIPSKYNPKETEEKWYKFWEENGFFHAEVNSEKKPYTIVIPPPNITGILHMGHALNNTIQDIYIRFKRMQGYETLWMPGTDHAGIATQNVVEKKLRAEGKDKESMGREKFLDEVWKWKEDYGSTIITQLKNLGCSCDWPRTRFTMDDGLSEAVREVFVKLYEKGLIYRGNYIINWCPRCKTALSDEEAQHRDVDGVLYYIKYPIVTKDEGRRTKDDKDHVVVATTRPETMLGDVAVCVNPRDKRYKHLKESSVILPVLNRELKVIFDSKVDPKFGTGVLKVTPAHDPVDFELGVTHGLEPVNIMNDDATINEAGDRFKGMDRFEAREAIIDELKERDLFVKSEPHRHAVGHCYRCHTMVEPRLSKQWFVKMKPLSKPALQAVKKGRIKFYPKRWTKVYINWMENIRDWCISRQIWWGHRIPVYYCKACIQKSQIPNPKSQINSKSQIPKEEGTVVSKVKPEKCPACGSTELEQDNDVLDTWFSSWLWPFSTMGWPEKTKELDYFYPTDVLVTAQEIIFFWVARMIMAGMEFMNDIPFRDVYIHGTVRDDTGTKMSKSLGNIIDPIDVINQFGSDALRFSIISITAQGQDVFLSPQKFEIGRNFANKLWNASRFVLMNLKEDMVKRDLCQTASDPALSLADRWILSRFYQMLDIFSKNLASYRINDAANKIYEFIWHEFCDWYLEMAKLTIEEAHTQITIYKVLEKSLRVLHPIMPFITEDIWQRLPKEHGDKSIMASSWPHAQKAFISKKIDADMQLVIQIIQAIRNLRATWRIEYNKDVDVFIKAGKKGVVSSIEKCSTYVKKLARVSNISISDTVKKPSHAALAVIEDIEIFIPLEGVIDLEKEKKRLSDKLDGLLSELKAAEAKLKNKNFVSKAPEEVVKKARERKESISTEVVSLRKNLKLL